MAAESAEPMQSSSQPPQHPQPSFPLPAILQHPSSEPPILITQGAEARLYRTTYLLPSIPCALKYRPPKPWRQPTLDLRLTRHRILSEARILCKCRRDGVRVPAVYGLDEAAGWLMLEWIDGDPVRVCVNAHLGSRTEGIRDDGELVGLMKRIGVAVGGMHRAGIVHGDLTTSNMMLSPSPTGSHVERATGLLDGELVIIDLGLAGGSTSDEDRAVDLYVLERAFGSTHPRAECLFAELLEAYAGSFKQARAVLKKLEDVRMRGRKRSMLG